MTLHGTVKNGVVLLEGQPNLPDGTVVKVQPIREEDLGSISEGLLRLAGTAQGLPADLARNHDHYLHGTSRR